MTTTGVVALFLPYGLAFFTLGVIALVIRRSRYTAVPLFQELRWLAGFGLIHGPAEWLTLLILIEAFPRPAPAVWGLAALNIVSFWCLLKFGVGLLHAEGRLPGRAGGVVNVIGGVAVVALLLALVSPGPGIDTYRLLDVFSRYLLGFTGAMITAAALVNTARSLKAFEVPRIAGALYFMAGCFAVYGLSTGLVVPQAGFFPASILNVTTFREFAGFPVELIRAVVATGAAAAFYVVADDVRHARESRLERLRESTLRAMERERLGHDLHDRVIQTLFVAGLRLESIVDRADHTLSGGEVDELGQVRRMINDSILETRRFIANPADPSVVTSLSAFMVLLYDHCERLRRLLNVSITVRFNGDPVYLIQIPQPHEWTTILEEAVANAVRHGGARQVIVQFSVDTEHYVLQVTDDGTGFDPATIRPGTGIISMHERARVLRGQVGYTHLRRGVCLTCRVPRVREADATGPGCRDREDT